MPPRTPTRDEDNADLLASLKSQLPALRKLLKTVSSEEVYEDRVYRLYHQSFKVYDLQEHTLEIVAALQRVLPDATLNRWFRQIVSEGTGKVWTREHNARWLAETRPIVEAFLHAKYFLEMACTFGRELDEPPQLMPSGWASVLYLYGRR